MKRLSILFIALAAAAAAQTPSEPPPSDTPQGFGQRLKENQEALHEYSFKRRIQVQVKGITRSRLELVRFVDGKREAVPLDGGQQNQNQQGQGGGFGGRGGLRGRIMKQKQEEMKEDIEHLTQFLHSYIESGALGDALKKAAISRPDSAPEGTVQLVAKGVVQPSDSLTLTWNTANHRPEVVEIASQLDGKPVNATIEFAALHDGPFYDARTVVTQPKKDITVTIDTFDYTRGSDPK